MGTEVIDVTLYRVVLSYAVYGVLVESSVIVRAAPIAAWSVGKTLAFFTQWVGKKRGTVEQVYGTQTAAEPQPRGGDVQDA